MTRFLAWLVHLYTALGLLCAAAMAVLSGLITALLKRGRPDLVPTTPTP